MKIDNIGSGTIEKQFLIVSIESDKYAVDILTASDNEILDGCLTEPYEIDAEESYGLLTSTPYQGTRKITKMEIGETLSLDGERMMITRLI